MQSLMLAILYIGNRKAVMLVLGLESKSLALEGRPWHKSSRPLIWLIPVFFLRNATNFLSLSLLSVSELVVASNAVLIAVVTYLLKMLCLHYKLYSFCFGLGLGVWGLDLGVWGLGIESLALGVWGLDLEALALGLWGIGLGLGLDGAVLVNNTAGRECSL